MNKFFIRESFRTIKKYRKKCYKYAKHNGSSLFALYLENKQHPFLNRDTLNFKCFLFICSSGKRSYDISINFGLKPFVLRYSFTNLQNTTFITHPLSDTTSHLLHTQLHSYTKVQTSVPPLPYEWEIFVRLPLLGFTQ